jgi:hypothetical protein
VAKSRRNSPRGKAKPAAANPETETIEDVVENTVAEETAASEVVEDDATEAEPVVDSGVEPAETGAHDTETAVDATGEDASPVVIEEPQDVSEEAQDSVDVPDSAEAIADEPEKTESEEPQSDPVDLAAVTSERNDPPADASQPQVIRETVVEKKAGFVPMALGGVVAAALGFGVATFMGGSLPFGQTSNPFEEQTQAALAAQGDEIATLGERVAQANKALEILDLAPLSNAVAGLEDQLAAQQADLTDLGNSIAAFESRLTATEKQPLAGAVGPEAIAAYERELEELRRSIADQQSAMDTQRAEIEAMAATARAAEASAEEKSALSASRTALAELTALAQDGKPFAAPLAVLQANGVAVPAALSAVAADGVATLPALVADFPPLAREALGIARRAAKPENGGVGLTSFFQNQLGARSVTPREGDDPDAVLSRAEAAAKVGELAIVLTEISALPEASQAVLTDWAARVAERRDALAAAAELAQELNKQ